MFESISKDEFAWYRYAGNAFSCTAGTRRLEVTNGLIIGIRPVARSDQYYLVTRDKQNVLFKVTARRASQITKTSRAVRVVKATPDLTPDAAKVFDADIANKYDADRFRPSVAPRNEVFGRDVSNPAGVETKNYQWRKVLDQKLEIDTNKANRKVTLPRNAAFGIRFVSPSQGGKLCTLDGVYESIPTATFDSLVAQTKLIPVGNRPDTVISPERVQEYRMGLQRDRIRERNAREKEERAQDAASRNQVKDAERVQKEREQKMRVVDGKENTEIAKQVAEAARQEEKRLQEKVEQRKREAGLTDSKLRDLKAGKGKSLHDAMKEEEFDDDGEDIPDIEQPKKEKSVIDAPDDNQIKDEIGKSFEEIKRELGKQIKDPDTLSAKITYYRGEYVADIKALRSGSIGGSDLLSKWDKLLEDVENGKADHGNTEGKKANADVSGKNTGTDASQKGKATDSTVDDDTDFEEDTDASDDTADSTDMDDSTDVDNSGGSSDATDGEDTGDDSEVDEDISDEDTYDDEELDDNSSDDEDQDASDDSTDDDTSADEDIDAADLEAEDDSSGISDEIAGTDSVDDDGDDLSDVEEEDDPEPAKPKKPKETKASKDADEGDSATDEEKDDAIDEESDDSADKDLPTAAGVKGADYEESDIIKFHDDKKDKHKYVIISAVPNKQNDRIIEYTVWDLDTKPDTYKVVRINTARGQSLHDLADKVGSVPAKEFNKIVDSVSDYTLDKSPIRS